MTSFAKILSGAAGLAMVAGAAAPAAAQSYYGSYNQGYDQSGGVVGAVINSVLGGGRYGAYGQGQDRVAVDQLRPHRRSQVSRDYRAPLRPLCAGLCNQGYATRVTANRAMQPGQHCPRRRHHRRRAPPNGVKVSGVIDLGMTATAAPMARATATRAMATRAIRTRATAIRAIRTRLPDQGYGNAYGQQAAVADLRFSCRVDFRGY